MAVIGLNGRGMVHAQNFARLKNSEVAYLCDVDSTVLAKAMQQSNGEQGRQPKAIDDFRRALDDKSVDAISIAAPDHWHAPMAILAMKAGKHVYLEAVRPQSARRAPRRGASKVRQSCTNGNTAALVGPYDRSPPHDQGRAIGRPYLVRLVREHPEGHRHGKARTGPIQLEL
jgi:hypothetical protein